MQNAVKFNKQGGEIKVTQDYDAETKQLRTKVYDNGIGISKRR